MGRGRTTKGVIAPKHSELSTNDGAGEKSRSLATRIVEWYRELARMDDHALVIVGAAFLENRLEQLIRVVLLANQSSEDLFGPDGGLGTLAGKNRFAHAIGLIDKEHFKGIDLFRKVRNRAAHADSNFVLNDPPISEWLTHLGRGYIPPRRSRRAYRSMLVHWCLYVALYLVLIEANVDGFRLASGFSMLPIASEQHEKAARSAWALLFRPDVARPRTLLDCPQELRPSALP